MEALGKKITLSMPNGEKRDAQFAIVELGSVLASHDEQTFAPAPGYPVNSRGQNVNDRNYEDDVAAQERVRDNARRLDPYRLLTTSRTPSGSPIVAGQKVGGKWVVVSGNNRTMSTKLAARQHPENYKAYVEALCEELEAFGFSATDKSERIDCQNGKLVYLPTGDGFSTNNDAYHFRQPLLVRIDYDFPAFQTQELAKYNQSTMKGKRAVDKTIERSNSLRENPLCKARIPQMIDEYERMSDFYADRNAQKQMLEALLQCNIITEQSIPEYYDDGYFTSAGKELVESVLAGVVLEKGALKAAERDGIKQARRVVVYAMPVLVSNSTFQGEANLIRHVNDAILYLNEMKSSGLPFDQYINQGALFSEKQWHPWAIYLSRLMAQGQRKFKTAIKAFNESVKRNTGAALFSDQNVTPQEAFQAYVIDHIPAEEAKLIEAYSSGAKPGRYGDDIGPDPRPGDYFVSVHDQGQKPRLVLGPFGTHKEAIDQVEAVRNYVSSKDPQGHFYSYGTARQEKGGGQTGTLNKKLGYEPNNRLMMERGVPRKTEIIVSHGIEVKVANHGGKEGRCRMPDSDFRVLSLKAVPGSSPYMQDYYKAVCETARRHGGIYYELDGPLEEIVNKLLAGALEKGGPSIEIVPHSRVDVCGKTYEKFSYIGKALPPPVMSGYEEIFMEAFGISQAEAHEIWQRAVQEYGRPLDDVSRAALIRRGKEQLDAYNFERSSKGYQYLQELSREMFAKEEKAMQGPKATGIKKPLPHYVIDAVNFHHDPDPDEPDLFTLRFDERNSDETRHVQIRGAYEKLIKRLKSEGFKIARSEISQFDPIDWETFGYVSVKLGQAEASTRLLLAKARKKKKLKLLQLA